MIATPDATVAQLRGRLVVSCQAPPSHPFDHPEVISRVAQAAFLGGAGGLRLDGADTVARVRAVVDLPIIGIDKTYRRQDRPLITAGFRQCAALAAAGAHIIAVESTVESPQYQGFRELVRRVHDELGVAVMADVATFEEGARAWDAGADLVGTTLAGYTTQTRMRDTPDVDLIAQLYDAGVRGVLEGRVQSPSDVSAGFAAGAWCVVAGKAITDPLDTTSRFARAAPVPAVESR